MDYINATPQQKEVWIQNYIKRRMARGNDLQRKGMGTAKGSLKSVEATARYKARVKWNKYRKRQLRAQKNNFRKAD